MTTHDRHDALGKISHIRRLLNRVAAWWVAAGSDYLMSLTEGVRR